MPGRTPCSSLEFVARRRRPRRQGTQAKGEVCRRRSGTTLDACVRRNCRLLGELPHEDRLPDSPARVRARRSSFAIRLASPIGTPDNEALRRETTLPGRCSTTRYPLLPEVRRWRSKSGHSSVAATSTYKGGGQRDHMLWASGSMVSTSAAPMASRGRGLAVLTPGQRARGPRRLHGNSSPSDARQSTPQVPQGNPTCPQRGGLPLSRRSLERAAEVLAAGSRSATFCDLVAG
jgi:hypothetical protein